MNLFQKKELKVILWSNGDEGKTSLLYKGFKGIHNFPDFPTVGSNIESIIFNGVNFKFMDIGGACKIKELRKGYLPTCDALIFFIDSSQLLSKDNYLFEGNLEEFKKCLNFIEDKPLLIAITKIDIRKTSTLDIIKAYQLDNLFKRKQKFGIIECSTVTSIGIKEIKYWLFEVAKNSK